VPLRSDNYVAHHILFWGTSMRCLSPSFTPIVLRTVSRRHVSPIHLEMEAGEVVLLHNHLVHKSEPNSTPNSRRALSVWYTKRVMPGDVGRCQVFPHYEPAVYPQPKL
jgi:ectoine hydroxylase-related dioxygenase (phytanoyl-CoA dioxygenase family)